MSREITFTEKQGEWVHEYTSTGPAVVQIESTWPAEIHIMAAVGDMKPASLERGTISERGIFTIDVPAGIKVTISSTRAITKAMMSDVEG